MERRHIHVEGTVTGVGFRWFVERHARMYGINGWVRNRGGSVEIEVEAEGSVLDAFERALYTSAPQGAQVRAISTRVIAPLGTTGFSVRKSMLE